VRTVDSLLSAENTVYLETFPSRFLFSRDQRSDPSRRPTRRSVSSYETDVFSLFPVLWSDAWNRADISCLVSFTESIFRLEAPHQGPSQYRDRAFAYSAFRQGVLKPALRYRSRNKQQPRVGGQFAGQPLSPERFPDG